MKAAIAILSATLLLTACGSSQPAADTTQSPATLVTTMAPQQGTLPLTIEAFGTATPAANGLSTLSVQQPGQVVAVPVVAGTRVRAGQPVIVFAVAPSARSSYQQAADAVRAAEEQRRTTAQLLTQQLATRDQLVQAEKTLADARVALAALRQEGAGVGTITLRAPTAGIVNTISVAPGDRTQPGQALATIARAGSVIVTVGVDPARRADLHAGAPVILSRLDPGGSDVAGRVVRVDATLNPKTRQIDVDIAYPTDAFLPGEALRALIGTGQASGWVVPHRAVVVASDGGAQLFQSVGGKAKAITVRILTEDNGRDLVTGPVDPHAPLIVDGAYQVGDGEAVRTGPRQ